MEAKVTDISQSEVERAIVKTSIEFKLGFENRTAEFDIFEDLPIKAGFSWGSESGTMSFKWKDTEEPEEKVYERIMDFMASVGISYPGVIHAIGVFEGSQDQLQAVDASDIENDDETTLKANFIYTSDINVAIVIRPADCPISIIYAKTKEGRDIAGLVHSSAVSTNAGIPRLAIRHLIEQEEIDPTNIRIGITPGIARENYSISDENGVNRNTYHIIERNWKDNIDPLSSISVEKRHVDILRATIMQYIEEGINSSQIEAYQVDTYASHLEGVGFSHRLYEESKQERNSISPGRYIVAAQLK